ncbi:bifunctional 4-hydroxy-2-oxoglutarate aldolase/2-dehydro-3-deoxy-phosphogluconate aldolase [Flavisolibacter tropicus]|uniref:Ketohydroxyglutarate aldolase n=1 Tax=Flavisolibacter tropicus TaxID=1492898 RepID=A0A172TRK0_9BACT|nr:bifunctional 4-hydroxy-2-oxoglutarate aldolase/2-dehydro-3-deoxy-phosphogluconate aldolase [Flavisolibacter tropicus]ANE49705.1 ketohydroxyglutarate aldolase [Flavisolibacter tropicus]
MHKKEQVLQALLNQKLLPLYYHESASTSLAVLRALYKGGVRLVEYTNRGANALSNFSELRKAVDVDMPDMLLGIGTIKNKNQAKQYIDAGADFIVCPSTNTEVAQVTQDAGLLWIPGCMTPTEIAMAENAGAELVKIFPGNLLGPSYISAVKDLFPGLKFMPTGGVEVEESNLKSWFNAGVVAVGMGSKLITKDMMEQRDETSIANASIKALALAQEAAK